MANATFLINGNQAAIINQDDDKVWVNIYVNVRGAKNAKEAALIGDITGLRWKGRRIKSAEKWAKNVLQII